MPLLLYTQAQVQPATGQTRFTSWWQGVLTYAVTDAVAGCSTGFIQAVQATEPQNAFAQATGTFAYGVLDAALLVFETATGNTMDILVMAPKPTVFTAGQIKVDPTDPDVAALIGAVLAWAVTESGEPITAFLNGRRIRMSALPVPVL